VILPLKISLPISTPENKVKRRPEESYLFVENQAAWKKRKIISGHIWLGKIWLEKICLEKEIKN